MQKIANTNPGATRRRNRAPHDGERVRVTVYRGARDPEPARQDDLTWTETCDTLEIEANRTTSAPATAAPEAQKRALLAWSPVRLSKPYRKNENVEAVTMLVLDVDHGDPGTVVAALKERGWAGLLYESPSSTPVERRFRVVAPVVAPIAPSECRATRIAFAEALGLGPGCGVEGAIDASKIFFVGRLHGTAEREAWCIDGKPVDVAALPTPTLKWGAGGATAATAAPLAELPPADAGIAAAIGRWDQHEGRRFNLCGAIGGVMRRRLYQASECEAVIRAWLPAGESRVDVERGVTRALGAWSKEVDEVSGFEALARLVGEQHAKLLAGAIEAGLMPAGVFERRREARARSAPSLQPETNENGAARTGCDPAVDQVIKHLATPSVGVFQRSGKLAIVTRDASTDGGVVRPEGTPTIRELVPARLKEIIRTTAGPRETYLAGDVLARGEWSHIRPLDAIVSYPVMRRDGSLLLASGYDAPTRTLAEIAIRVEVSDAPTQADARAAVATLYELVNDFPFAGEAQRSAWLAMLLTVPARPAIDGPTPLGLLEATQRASGKSMLADAISLIVTGAEAPRRVAPKTREEWDKVLFSILLAGDPLVLFDNVTNMLVSDALDAVLTGTSYAQRLLGVSEDRCVAIRTVFLASANNARLSTDLVRRSVGCRLEPDVERPETRTGFRLPDLLGHIREHRSRYLSAALTVLRAYVIAGRPTVKARPMGSYTAWCRVVRDALVWAGAADPAETQDALRETADVERDELRDLLSAWHGLLGEAPVTVRDLLEAARTGRVPGVVSKVRVGKFSMMSTETSAALRGITPNGAEPAPHVVGNALRTRRGNIVGGLALQSGHPARGGKATWLVRRVG